MHHASLEEVAEFINGYAFKPSDWNGSGKKIIRIQNLTDNTKPFNRTDTEVPKKYYVRKGNILVSWSATLDIFEWTHDETALLNQHIFKVEFKEDIIDKKYFKYILKNVIQGMLKYSHGSTMKHIVRGDFLKTRIPLPSLSEQKRIAEILDKADSIRQKRKESIALLDEFLRSVFLDMFGDPVRNEKRWEKINVIDVCDCIVPGRDKPKSFSGIIPWITTDDLKILSKTYVSKKKLGLTIEEIKEVRARIIPKGSVLLTCVGDLGVISLAANDMVINQQLHSFQCSEKINNVFLMFQLSKQKNYMYKMASSTTVPYMNKSVCNGIPIILPPINLQTQFAKIVEQVESTKAMMEESLKEMDNQFNGLLQRVIS